MEVTFERTTGKPFTVMIRYFSTVRQVKEVVKQMTDIPVESQRLFLQGKELDQDDDKGIEEYSIVEGSRILVAKRRQAAARR